MIQKLLIIFFAIKANSLNINHSKSCQSCFTEHLSCKEKLINESSFINQTRNDSGANIQKKPMTCDESYEKCIANHNCKDLGK